MSHPRYNAFAPGNQMSPVGPYRPSGGQMERDPQRGQPHCGSGSSYTSSGSSSSNCGPPGRPIPSLLSLPVKYRPEKIGTTVDKDMERHVDLNISRAREPAMQYSASQSPQFTNVQKDTFSSSFTGKNSFLMSAPAQVGALNMDSGGSNLDWLPICQTSSKRELPKAHSPVISSSFQSSRIQTTGSLRGYGTSFLDKRGTPQETIQPSYTSEFATKILLQFGLYREDLDQLSSYPEDQLTPQNLPFILRQIHLEKVKRTSNPYDESQTIGSMGELDMPITPRSSVPDPDEVTSQVFSSSKVIDYGHTSKSKLSSFGSLNKDRGFGKLKSNAPKTNPLKKSAPAHQKPSKTQPSKPSSNLMRGVHPGRPGLVLIGSNAETDNSDWRRSGEQSSNNPKMRDKKKISPQQKQQLQRHQQLREPSQRDAVTCSGSSKKLPTWAMMQDYAGATPRVFPYTCCLCMKECTSMKDWQYHWNTGVHLDNCIKLRQRYPLWDGQTPEFPSGPGKDTQPASSTSQNLQHRHQRSVHENLSRSLSPLRRNESEDRKERQDRRDRRLSPQRSRSPHPHRAFDSRRERRDSRSQSSQTSRQTFRSRSRSYERLVSSRHRSRSRSHERRSPPSRREAKRSSPRRSHEHRPSPRSSEERRSSTRRNYERRSSGDGSEPHHKRSRSADRLTKRLLEETAVHSRSTQSDLEAMVKTLAPVLLAELANLKSYAALSSSTSRTENKSSSNSTKASSSSQRTRTSSSSGFNKVTLSGVLKYLSHSAILEAMEKIGKVKNLTLFRSRLEARVRFEKEEDARKLLSYGGCNIKGYTLSVSGATGIASNKPLQGKEQKMAPKKLSLKSTSSKSQTSHTISKSTATSKLVTKAKVLVSKAKSISTKQLPKTVKKSTSAGKSAGVKSIGVKQAASLVPKATTAGKKPEANKIKTVKNTKPVRTLQQSKTTSTAKAQTTIKELQQSSASNSESKSDAVEKQKQPTKKTKTLQDSVLMKKEKSSMDENKERKLSSGRFIELDFSTGDFVTVDEVNEDMVDKTENRSFSSKPTSKEKEARGSAVHTGVRKTLSSYSSSKSAKGNQSGSTSAGVNPNTKSSSKLKKCVTNATVDKTSPSSPFVKSVKTPSSSGQKAQTVKKKPPSRSLGPSSSVGNNCSSATAQKTSIKNQQGPQKHKKPAESTVTKPDHKGSLEKVAANTVVTKSTSDASSQMDISAEGQILQGNVEKDLKDETIQEMIEKKAEENENDTNSKNTEENGRDVKKEVLGFLHKEADEQQNGEDQEKNPESQIPRPEQDCTAVEMADTDKLDDCHEMEMDVSTKPQDSTPVEQATIGNNNSKQTPGSVSEKMELENNEDDQGKKTKTQIPEPEKDQTIHQCGLEVVEGADKMEIDVSTKPQDITSVEQATTADDGDEGPTVMQVSEREEAKEIHSPEESSVSVTSDRDKETSEDTNPTPNSGGDASTLKPKEGILLSEKVCETSEEDGQISNEDQPLETGDSKDTLKDQKLVDPTDVLAKSEDKFKEEVYRAIDSSEDPPTKATVESEPEKKEGTEKERTTRSGDYRTRESRSRSRTSKSEEKDKTTKQLDKATKKPTTKTSKTKKEEMSVKDLEEPVYEVLDSIEDDAVEETATNTGRRRSARGKKTDEKILAQVEEPKTSEKVEEIFTVLDSVEDERPEDKAVTTRSTRGRKENAAKKVEENAKTRDNKTPRRRTPARDSKEKETEKSPKTDVGVSSKESTPGKGRLGKDNETSTKQTSEEEPPASSLKKESDTKDKSLPALDEAGHDEAKEADEVETIQMSNPSKRKHSDNTAVEEENQELTTPDAKRTHCQSPCVSADLQLPPFNPKNPLGEEFVVPKSGFFCNLCSMFYMNENSAKKIHCSSQKHYNNLVKHYQKLKQETSGTTSQSIQD
ncbi:PREDICTED: zinc finger protein 638-like isoform X1 [Cyprinodon variegatus]|uniref:zinc finger protein 638-like isoform X1 n=1 Tax=Cyprinodon variegatus TaxID=28743 RepID=UPI000742B125|nr:PREDICTED: zinc finger protein 638-like isoform X1 [Cyprinodon variegatus]XP_015247131.1 PREDICTED: zinc finger protein 638-like isoform X1 [Cyprinodon variegatus]